MVKYKVRDSVLWRIIEDDTVLLNLKTNYYYSLNKTGSIILRELNDGKSIEEVVEYLFNYYKGEVERTELAGDVDELISDLSKEEMIERVN